MYCALPLLLSAGVASSARALRLSSESCWVAVPHTEVQCVMPSGVGTDFQWTLAVAGQVQQASLALPPTASHRARWAPSPLRWGPRSAARQ